MKFNRRIFERVVKALVKTQGYTHDEAVNVKNKLDAITDDEYKALAAELKCKPPYFVHERVTAFIRQRIPELEDAS